MHRDMPDGFAAAIRELQDVHNISVLLPYNPWDHGTRFAGASDAVAMTGLVGELGARGFNGDTLEAIPDGFWRAALEGPGPMLMQPEEGGDASTLYFTKAGWAYWKPNDACALRPFFSVPKNSPRLLRPDHSSSQPMALLGASLHGQCVRTMGA